MTVGTIILIILIILLLGGMPTWKHSENFGWGPSGIIGVFLLVVLILIILGRI